MFFLGLFAAEQQQYPVAVGMGAMWQMIHPGNHAPVIRPAPHTSKQSASSSCCPSCCQYLKRKVGEEPEYTNMLSCACNTSSLILSILSLVL